ncbi:hypothetical protein PV10_08720 [Exophiala mesophila]|uniref:Protein phosphatase methylesterase 1 n=1 Tax=Exophiala mesophila TaxID=212818 RepID=A0A0D1XLR9_EXOME|nr:uncharacterized protein PV10_08720 [Exophiala mesophila]KIV89121.1 hypothetical protein PV10_08720 [Exophiala mesophila]
MSDLQRSFAKSQLSKLPPEPPPVFNEQDEIDQHSTDTSDLGPSSPNGSSSSASSASSAGTIVPSPSRNLFEKPRASNIKSRSAPLPWDDFYSQDLILPHETPSETVNHHVYLTPPSAKGPLIITHHGAGSSGLSFATFTQEFLKLIPNAGVLSIDARGHGLTTMTTTSTSTSTTPTPDLTLATLASDLAFVVESVITHLKLSDRPDMILIGHSLGGAVVVEVAHQRLLGPSLLGYGVLDVVEGSAMDALQSMDTYLSTRPQSFLSLSSAIEWHTRSRTIRNTTSARVSVPSLLQPLDNTNNASKYVWRTDLAATKPFWENWFVGLSSKFLTSRGAKLLLLAGTDRLDKELMIGQMQGKYQLQVFPEAGHFVHEDQPAKTAMVVADFYRRNDRSALVLPPKVDELIRQGKLKPAASS